MRPVAGRAGGRPIEVSGICTDRLSIGPTSRGKPGKSRMEREKLEQKPERRCLWAAGTYLSVMTILVDGLLKQAIGYQIFTR